MSITKSVAPRSRLLLFVAIVTLMLLIAVGHLPIIEERESLVRGLPLWMWLHWGVLAILLGLAWLATRIITDPEVGDR